ncbi:MAG TPA: ABC transporter permease [Actinomycetota bacterium]
MSGPGQDVASLPQPPVAEARRGRGLHLPRFALAIPAWLLFLFFFAVPVLWILYYSFGYKPSFLSGQPIATDQLSVSRYGEALSGTFFLTFKNTFQISVIGTFLCLVIGFPFAYWLAVRVDPKWRGLLLGLVIVPFWTNFLVRTIGLRIWMGPQGPISGILQDLGILGSPLDVLFTKFAVQVGVVYNYLPLMILPIFVALDRLDPALREASKDLGAGRFKTMRQVTVPLAMPGIIAGALLVFIPLTGDYITASVLGGAKGNMVGRMVADQFLTAQNWALGSAMAMVLIGMILLAVGLFALIGLGLRALVQRKRRVVLAEVPA